MDGGERHNDEKWTANALSYVKLIEEHDALNCFTQAHLVRQDGVGAVVP